VLTMNSVKILHAVRSAITAIAELLVIVIINEEEIRVTLSHRDVAGALYII